MLLFDDSVLISPPSSSLRTANAVLPTTFGMFQAEQKEGQLLGATVYSNGVNVVVSHAHNENLKRPGIPSPPLPPLLPPPSPSSSSTPNFCVFHSLLLPLFLIHLLPLHPPSTSSCLSPRPVPQPGLPLASMTQLSPAATTTSASPTPCHEGAATGPTEI